MQNQKNDLILTKQQLQQKKQLKNTILASTKVRWRLFGFLAVSGYALCAVLLLRLLPSSIEWRWFTFYASFILWVGILSLIGSFLYRPVRRRRIAWLKTYGIQVRVRVINVVTEDGDVTYYRHELTPLDPPQFVCPEWSWRTRYKIGTILSILLDPEDPGFHEIISQITAR